ncbi:MULTISPECIES: histidine phosphatase family protein [unclassified Paracoccus (in: a-proteobacteria)]|uniref:SixA phosphatase family protein n=1 Tax=unclassified Paracoccus (in: a-proteobacteria) TaxID=2688777 RepID=UPI0016036413|nr:MULTISPECIES: histidine phosphatase family protein [unclassified Paracoccus (in: a-proteobacteria)]MBB1491609.1 histidine phosphatase family protein [Paracoccus sp. MC1854]MBB1498285.1 histidine phosphatase family protein [Paracoccus sp. MC1862]QQO44952.1 histidine phosphatase family protein [Paracoccus sp. MC1862]
MTPLGHCRLILTRHAKSDWDDPTLPDHDRPLNARGLRSARALGDWLASRGYEPEEVLCSSSRRTRETWDCVAQAVFETRPDLRIEPALYHAAPELMLRVLKTATAPTVMMIGHNPGIAAFAAMLPARPPLDPQFRRYPTAATLVVDFQSDNWAEIEPGQGSVRDFVRLDGRD